MPLTPGQSLSFYEILGPLGAGGMGEVYRAKDTRLDREVAIKVLPEHFADDGERLRRFEREAKTLASLNHQNIAGIHGIDQVGDTCFLAMELVSGEDLEQRLKRGALPVDEALDVCRQIAEGLEVAHEAGVVHRDLKPANVRLTPEGVVKILDFGLAKPMGPRARGSGTTGVQSDSFLVTSEGMILGTPTYMSPEQARGKPVDRRADIWAFGCVLSECLTGKRAFQGDAFGDLIVAILEREPDLDALPASTPPHVRQLIARCLVKDPRERLRDIGEARLALAHSGALVTEHSRGSRAVLPWTLALVASALAVFFAWPSAGADSGSQPGLASAALRHFEPMTFGQQLVYNARFLPGDEGFAYSAALSGNRPEVFLLQPVAKAARAIAPVGTHLLSVSATGELAVLIDARYLYHHVHEGTLARMTIDASPRALPRDSFLSDDCPPMGISTTNLDVSSFAFQFSVSGDGQTLVLGSASLTSPSSPTPSRGRTATRCWPARAPRHRPGAGHRPHGVAPRRQRWVDDRLRLADRRPVRCRDDLPVTEPGRVRADGFQRVECAAGRDALMGSDFDL